MAAKAMAKVSWSRAAQGWDQPLEPKVPRTEDHSKAAE